MINLTGVGIGDKMWERGYWEGGGGRGEQILVPDIHSFTISKTKIRSLKRVLFIVNGFSLKIVLQTIDYVDWRSHCGMVPHDVSFEALICSCTQQKTHNLFRVVENSIVQCCAAHVVHSCQQYCSALLHLIAG